MDFTQKFKALVRTSTPIVLLKTFDQPAATTTLAKLLTTKKKKKDDDEENGIAEIRPVLQWDLLRGIRSIQNLGDDVMKVGEAALNQALKEWGQEQPASTNPVSALECAQFFPAKTIMFMQNTQNFFSNGQRITEGTIAWSQGLLNCRDPFKATQRMIVALCPEAEVPQELTPDIVVLDEPLPTEEQLVAAVETGIKGWNANNKVQLELAPDVLKRATGALVGTESLYAADQIIAVSLTKRGFDFAEMNDRRRQSVKATPGMQVMTDNSSFDDLEGYEPLKTEWRQYLASLETCNLIVFQDEIEKGLPDTSGQGSETGSSGTEMLGETLTEMQEQGYTGYMIVGPPGTGKSKLAKCMAGEAKVEIIGQSMGSTKSKWVGESVGNLRRQFKIIRSMSGGKGVVFVATCNRISSVPTELLRRYKLGVWVMGFPTPEERDAIWKLYTKKLGLKDQDRPADHLWTGAEIENCCRRAWSRNISLIEAAERIVPVIVSNKARLTKNMMDWSGKYNSAQKPGIFSFTEADLLKKKDPKIVENRAITAEEDD